jgi:competence protein ComEC
VGLLPLLGYFFQQVSVIAPLANLLAIPVIALVLLPLSLLTLVMLSCFPFAGEPLLALTVKGFDLFMACLAGLERGLPTVWEQAGFGLAVLLLSLLGAVLLLMPRGLPGRSLAGIMLLPLLLPLKPEWNRGTFRTTVLDVGQGLSVLIETNKHRLLYDTGARYRSGMDAARLAVLPFFRFQGIRSLDRLIVSHGDNDHAGGVDSLLQNIAVGQIQTGSLKLRERYPQMANCKPGSRWQWDGVTFSWLHSGEDSGNNENNRSCVLKVDNGEYSVLLTGDIEANREKQLVLKHTGQLKADLLVASHHGSGNASSELFIRQVDPVHVVYSASYQNRYGHPHPRVVERFKRAGALQWSTAQTGMLSVQAERGREPIYSHYRDTRWAYWLD